ncbi:MAG: hypothetical protein ABSG38_16490 [Spirochaetia bacterium]
MQIHFHFLHVPITFSVKKGENLGRELEEKTSALLWYAMRLPIEGARARYVLRKYAGGSPQ